MSTDKPPSALSDVRKGLGLLFRAATTTARKLPTTNLGKELEAAVKTSAREVGRAFENVASSLEREVSGVFGKGGAPKPGAGDRADNPAPTAKRDPSKDRDDTRGGT